MLSAIFSFRGRLNRLQYFGGICGLTAAVVVAVLVAVLSVGSLANVQQHPGVILPALLIGLLAIPVWIWVTLSLEARRIRDIGLNPAIVIPSVIGLDMLDQAVASALPAVSVGPGAHHSIVGIAIDLGYAGCLLFWPAKPDDAPASRLAWEPPTVERPSRGEAASRPAANGAAPTFGRRGL